MGSRVARSQNHVSCDLDGEVLLLSIENGCYYHMNETASRIWELLDSPHPAGAICTALAEEYDVDRETCEQEVLRMLAEMRQAGLVVAE